MNRERIIEYTCDLVNIPTENRPPLGFEAEGQKYIRKRLEELGMEIVEVGPEDIPVYETNPLFSHDRDFTGRKSIAGIWRGKGNGKSVLLNGHMDVAPKEPMAWTVTEPFQALVKDGKILGKPQDEEDAFKMLMSLRGRAHQVFTGVAVLDIEDGQVRKKILHAEKTEVFVHSMSAEEIRRYVASGEPMDKAGAYGIQGRFAAFIDGIQGDYYNVVGLPVAYVYQVLKQKL